MKGLTKESAKHIKNLLSGYLDCIKKIENMPIPNIEEHTMRRRSTLRARRDNLSEERDNYEKYFFKEINN